MRISIYHNLLWSKYKGRVFGRLYALAADRGDAVRVVHIAETQSDRAVLAAVDLSYHQYPYRLLFKGSYDSPSALRKAWKLALDLLRHPADVTVLPGYDQPEYWAMLLVCMLLRRRRAVFCDSTMQDRSRTGLKERAKRFFFGRCDGFFTYGVRGKEYLQSYGVPEQKIHIRYQAAALPHEYSAAKVLESYESSADDGRLKFLYVGRLSVEKGLRDLLEALAIVRGNHPQARLDLVGAGPLKSMLQARAAELGLADEVAFLGSRDIRQLAQLYREADALVLPSHSEPWGLVANEALSYGCPLVVSDACGCEPALVRPGVTGFAFPARDVTALAAAMSAVATLTPQRQQVARQCIELIAEFSPERAASQILDGCRKIAATS